jgi:hypothetical protein
VTGGGGVITAGAGAGIAVACQARAVTGRGGGRRLLSRWSDPPRCLTVYGERVPACRPGTAGHRYMDTRAGTKIAASKNHERRRLLSRISEEDGRRVRASKAPRRYGSGSQRVGPSQTDPSSSAAEDRGVSRISGGAGLVTSRPRA